MSSKRTSVALQQQQNFGGISETDWRSIYIVSTVSILDSMRIAIINVNSWAYLTSLDQNVGEQFFGQINAAQTFCSISASLFSGWLSNKISHTKPPILIGALLICLGCLLYANLGLAQIELRKWGFMAAHSLMGMGSGMMMAWRVSVAMCSLEKDRAKANSLTGFGFYIGFILGPIFVLVLGYALSAEDLALPWGTTLNLYTAPTYLIAAICLIFTALIWHSFDGQIWKEPPKIVEKKMSINPPVNCWLPSEKCRLDYRAIVACFTVRICFTVLIIYLSSLSGPYAMTVFGWSGQQAVIYFMVLQGICGILGLLLNLGYALHLLDRIKERFAILLSLSCFLCFFLLTFTWPFLSAKLPKPQYSNTTLKNGTILNEKVTEGCEPNEFTWCNDTPAINIILYFGTLILVQGLAMPASMLNLDVLYSKLLGQIKQGTMQGLFVAIGDFLNLGGPILATAVYQSMGPRPIWFTEIGTFTLGICIWLSCYGRLKVKGT